MECNNLQFPLDRKYHRSHIWVKAEDDTLRMGIDDFLANKAGYINFLTVDKKEVEPGESFGSLESGKFVSKIYSPAGGTIVDINQEVLNNPRKINEDPYGAWIIVVKPGVEVEGLFETEEDIQKWIEEETKKYEEEEQQLQQS